MLTVAECRSAAPGKRAYQRGDAGGLFLYVLPSGFKSWRFKYYFQGREKRLTFGPFPEVSLKEARDLRDEARRSVRRGVDPGAASRSRAAGSTAPSFEALAMRWHDEQKPIWTIRHAADVLASFKKHVFPAFGATTIDAVTTGDVRSLLEDMQRIGSIETAHRVRGRISAVFRLGIALELVETDPAAPMDAVLRPIPRKRMPAARTIGQARALLAEAEAIEAYPATKLASRLLALTAARPGMIRFAERREFEALDTDQPIWRVPAAKMKLELALKEDEAFDFVLPLAAQSVALVKAALVLSKASPWLFPSTRWSRRPMSENALSSFYRRVPRARGRHVPHGWRASFSTIMNERAALQDRPGDRAVIDLMLAHKPAGVESRYNRAAYMPRRRVLAQEWADLLLEGFAPAATLLEGPRR